MTNKTLLSYPEGANGSLLLWINSETLKNWRDASRGKRGRPRYYSDQTILSILALKTQYRLSLRAARVLTFEILKLLGSPEKVPSIKTLSIRARSLEVELQKPRLAEALELILDSTGLLQYNRSHWKKLTPGINWKEWVKLHLAIDQDGNIVSAEITTPATHDSKTVKNLIALDAPIKQVCADGAYDREAVYKLLYKQKIKPLIPPAINAKIYEKPPPHLKGRNRAAKTVRTRGKSHWKKRSGYHIRSRVEAAISRLKRLFGEALRARRTDTQRTEIMLKLMMLNTYLNMS
jgi:hypothetical protein